MLRLVLSEKLHVDCATANMRKMDWQWEPGWAPEEYEHHLTKVCEAIREAFRGVPYPGDDNITVGQAYHPEDIEIAESLQGKHWEELPREIVCNYGFPMPLLTPAAFQYYLPAFLLARCKRGSQLGTELYIMEILPLHREADEALCELQQRFDHFTSAQKKAIKYFLELRCYMREEDAQWVYSLYWKQFR